MHDVRTHTDGGQTAEAVSERVVAWLGSARRTLDLALYDVRLPGAVLGSFNLSRSGETNAENVLEITDAALADRLAAFVDELRARYPAL